MNEIDIYYASTGLKIAIVMILGFVLMLLARTLTSLSTTHTILQETGHRLHQSQQDLSNLLDAMDVILCVDDPERPKKLRNVLETTTIHEIIGERHSSVVDMLIGEAEEARRHHHQEGLA